MSGKSCCGAPRGEDCDCYKESLFEQILEVLIEIKDILSQKETNKEQND